MHIVFAATTTELDRSLVDAATAATARARPLYSPKKSSSSSLKANGENSSSRALAMKSFAAVADLVPRAMDKLLPYRASIHRAGFGPHHDPHMN
jgi:hypothetical protein